MYGNSMRSLRKVSTVVRGRERKVREDVTFARCGNTGLTTPHLHFDVKSGCAPPEWLQM